MKRHQLYFLLLPIFTIWWFPSALVGAETDKYPQRMALAISGGASKGAYEAGFNWGALKILRNFSGKDPILGG